MKEVEKEKSVITKWKAEFVVIGYELAREAMTEKQMAKVMGISVDTFRIWERDKPLFAYAIQRGRQWLKSMNMDSLEDFRDDVYRTLTPDERVTWEKIHQLNIARSAPDKVRALLKGRGKELRQKMFLCALMKCRFNVSAACRTVDIPRETIERWRREDKKFWALVEAVERVERDWSEGCLRRLVESCDFPAVKFHLQANYRAKYGNVGNDLNLNVQGKMEHEHTFVTMEDLDLPLNIQKMILTKMREKQKERDAKELGDAGE